MSNMWTNRSTPRIGHRLGPGRLIGRSVPYLPVGVPAPAVGVARGADAAGVGASCHQAHEGEPARHKDGTGRILTVAAVAELTGVLATPAPRHAPGVHTAVVAPTRGQPCEPAPIRTRDLHRGALIRLAGATITDLPVGIQAPAVGHAEAVDATGVTPACDQACEREAAGHLDPESDTAPAAGNGTRVAATAARTITKPPRPSLAECGRSTTACWEADVGGFAMISGRTRLSTGVRPRSGRAPYPGIHAPPPVRTAVR
jgi:hypothetical protein